MITHEELVFYLDYDKDSGIFRWKNPLSSNVIEGSIAGSFTKAGYIQISIKGVIYKAHRLAWLYVNKVWPEFQIDHKNKIRSDNRYENLRQATHVDNNRNRTKHKSNSSGFNGVCFHKKSGKWMAYIKVDRKSIHLGYFESAEFAANARKLADIKYSFDASHGDDKP